ncbi:hypothetical protein [Blastococcus sp. SYSU DS0619]
MTSTPRAPRLAGALLAGGVSLAALTGCSFTSQNVECSGGTCTVTLSGDGAQAEIFGTTLSFDGVQDGRASITVGGTSFSCGAGEGVAAGPLDIACSSVTDDSVQLTATVG